MEVVSSFEAGEFVTGTMGRYVPFARLGTGGMADVFLAMAQGTHGVKKLTVVKRLREPGDENLVRMFLDEARLAARLNHANIVHTYEVGEDRGNYFIVMEYLEAQPLSAVLKKLHATPQRFADAAIATICAEVLKGLHYAHEFRDYDGAPLGIVHRDVSPHNILIGYDGTVKLFDFGIAKTTVESIRTATGILKGKLGYMSPEQAALTDVDRRADIFAVGVVLWEMLVRRRLFRGDPVTVLHRILNEEVPAPSTFRPDVPPAIEAIVMKALARDREQRFRTADEMRLELERFVRSDASAASSGSDLNTVMKDLFATTRADARSHIQAYIAQMDGDRSATGLTGARDLPLIGAPQGGASIAPSVPASVMENTRGHVSAAAPWIGIVGGVLGVVAIASFFAFPRYRTVAVSAPASVLTAQAWIETTPPGALVEWNGRRLGLTPTEVSVDPGVQRLAISLDGYEPEMLTMEVKPGDSLVRSLVLHPNPRAAAPAAPVVKAKPPAIYYYGRSQPAPATPAPVTAPAPTIAPTKTEAAAPRLKIQMIDESEAAKEAR